MNIRYEDYQRLIFKRAWTWSGMTGIELEELISEGNMVFCISLERFDPLLSSFSTFLYNSLNIHFGNLAKGIQQSFEYEDVASNPSIHRLVSLKSVVDKLSEDAQTIIRIVLDTPYNLMIESKKKINRNGIKRYMVKYHNWTIYRCWASFKEIQLALDEV